MIKRPITQKTLEAYIKDIEPLKKGFDYLNDHVVITDANANILYANKAAQTNTGFSTEEMIGRNPVDLWGGKMPKEFYERMWQVIKQEKRPFVGEVFNEKKDGTEYWQELHISPILDDQVRVKFFIAIEPDITDRKKKDEFREEFISIVGHQLRSPLTAIRWTLDLLAEDETITQEQKQSLSRVYEENKHLLDLVRDLLTISRVGKTVFDLHAEKFNLEDEIQNIIEAVKKQHVSVVIEFHRPPRAMQLTVNKSLALQIFNNIIFNAVEYVHQKHGEIIISLREENGQYIFICQDNGIGIPKEQQRSIFFQFFRASNANKAKESGTGLGLYIVKMIVEAFGWQVSFKSEEGQGSTFRVIINP